MRPSRSATLDVGGVHSLPYPDGCFDVVVSHGVLDQVTTDVARRAMDEVRRTAVAAHEVPNQRDRRDCQHNHGRRYLVLPERPDGTESLTEDELAKLVTRDSMIGVANVDSETG